MCKVWEESVDDERFACDHIRVAVMVESVLFESWGGCYGSQKGRYGTLIFNLKDQKNPDFRRKVLVGDIKAERLVDMSSAEMASDKWQSEMKRLKEMGLYEREREVTAIDPTDQFRCCRCGKHTTSYFRMQAPSAGKPMTTFVRCESCDNRWKFC
ncbi:hypothetical protein ACLB2K_009419 [Fragaria x ananassa]